MSSIPINIADNDDDDEEESDDDFNTKPKEEFPNTFETIFGPVSLGQSSGHSSAIKNNVSNSVFVNSAAITRKQTFQPARFVIPSVRMGPPYSGIGMRHPGLYDAPVMGPAFKQVPMAYRNRLFLPSTNLLEVQSSPVINLEETSASSAASGISSDEGMTEDDISSIHSATNDEQQPIEEHPSLPAVKVEPRSEMKATMSGGQTRTMEPILISDSDESSNENTKDLPDNDEPRPKKAKLSSSHLSELSKGNPNVSTLLSMLPQSDSDEDMMDVISYGMAMINPETLITNISEADSVEKPKRINLKGLYSQVRHGSLGKVMAFLRAGANPAGCLKTEEGKTPLHMAASKGHLEILLLLLYKAGKSKVDAHDYKNRTPLFLAVERKHLLVAQFLVNAGADFNVKNAEGMGLLHVAARKGALPMIKWLVKLGVPLNEQDNYGWTSLMWAAESDNNAILISYLIKKGALTNLLDNERNICLHWSAIAGSFECTKALVSGSLDPHVNARNKFGETPLHVAAKGDHFHVTQYLLLQNADHAIKNKSNATPLDVCPAGSKTFHCIRIRNEVGEAKKYRYKYVSDISHGKERIPVSCINEVDDEPFPCDFVYITKPEESNHVTVRRGLSTVRPCTCQGSCNVTCKCVKLSENQKLWYSDDGRLDISIFEEESPVLYECTPLCSCWNSCANRLVQKGIQHSLQVYKTKNKGWGLRSLVAIPLGSFVLSYVGELISDDEAERRHEDTYLFNLDLKTSGDEPNCMDALRFGNCGRFINHSCDANMRAVKLFTSQRDVSFPEVAFFAYRNIQANEELCFNYGDSFWDVKMNIGVYCKCESEGCLYRRP